MASFVYIFEHSRKWRGQGDRRIVKVGKANDHKQRERQGNTWAPYGITVLHTYKFPTARYAESQESYIHRRFSRYAISAAGRSGLRFPWTCSQKWILSYQDVESTRLPTKSGFGSGEYGEGFPYQLCVWPVNPDRSFCYIGWIFVFWRYGKEGYGKTF